MRRHYFLVLCAAAFAAAPPLAAQSLAQRVERAPAGADLSFDLPAATDLCGYGEAIIRFDPARPRGYVVSWNRKGDDELKGMNAEQLRRACSFGPMHVLLERNGRIITRVSARVGSPLPEPATDLGQATPADAAAYLLGDATRHAEEKAAGEAMFVGTLLDTEWWPGMLTLARDRELPAGIRRNAIFWLSQAAGDRTTRGLTSILQDDSEELELRKHVVFALSQQKGDAAFDALVDLARTAREPELRRNALFWLGQKDDPRVLALFQQILTGK